MAQLRKAMSSQSQKTEVRENCFGPPNILFMDEKKKPPRLFQYRFPGQPTFDPSDMEKVPFDYENKNLNDSNKNLELPKELRNKLKNEITNQLNLAKSEYNRRKNK